MKKTFCIIFIISILLSFCACSNQNRTIVAPAQFFYCTSNISFNTQEDVIASEIRETADFSNDLTALANDYLSGPSSAHLRSPFPYGSAVLWINTSESELVFVMNQQFMQLSGIEQSLACSCLSKTFFLLTDAERITIRGREGISDSKDAVIMTRDNLLFQDRSVSPIS